MSKSDSYDVVIVGGAVTGSSAAYHLANDPDFKGRILVVEQDPGYTRCASTLSAASIRQQFSTEVNIAISLYGISFLRNVATHLAVDGDVPDIQLKEGGYLFLATPEGWQTLEENHRLQTSMGGDILFMEPDGLKERFPWLNTDDIAAGCWGQTGEGWFDGYGLMQAFRRKARSLGVEYLPARAAGLVRENGRISAVELDDGSCISCGTVINAAGCGAAALAATAGVEIPVHGKKRMIFTFDCREEVKGCPLMIDPSGVYVRPEGTGFICGLSPPPEMDPDTDDFEVDYSYFEEAIWPVLANRVPAFEAIKPGRAWAGHYDMNLFDHNVILGPVGDVPNLLLANGFSGHGLQQSPAIGRALCELIVHGAFRTLDLSALSFDRLAANRPLIEKNVV